jgi:hypothetical protein
LKYVLFHSSVHLFPFLFFFFVSFSHSTVKVYIFLVYFLSHACFPLIFSASVYYYSCFLLFPSFFLSHVFHSLTFRRPWLLDRARNQTHVWLYSLLHDISGTLCVLHGVFYDVLLKFVMLLQNNKKSYKVSSIYGKHQLI